MAYWPGDRNNPPRIIFTTGRKMMALNARTGKVDPGFGKEGSVDLEVPYDGAPTIYKNLLFIGTNFYGPGERHIAPQLDQAGGQIPEQHAYDVRTGKELWTFHTFPRDGELGNETWAKDTWKNRTGNNVWAFALTVDEERGILYIPVSGPGANFYGGDRPGANLFGNTLVALDANTGKMKWYFQTVHHELWDYNLPPAPGLIDIKKDGKTIPALAQVGKSGYMYILDRVTGEPVYGVEERPVAKSDVPGEASYPTQPFPLEAAADFAHQHDQGRHRHRGGHHARSRQSLPGTLGSVRTAQRRSVHAVSRITPTAIEFQTRDHLSGIHRRRQLGRHGHRSEARLYFRQHQGRSGYRLDAEESEVHARESRWD